MVGVNKNSNIDFTNLPIAHHMRHVREENARLQKNDYSHVFRPKTRFDLIRLSCIIAGIELAYAAETAFVSPILLSIGIDHKHMTMVWGLSPLLGFFMAPLLGSLSDRCRLRLGRRRPILILLSLGVLIGLVLVPYGQDLGILIGDQGFGDEEVISLAKNSSGVVAEALTAADEAGNLIGDFKYAVIFTILGTILLDFDADILQTPSRAYLLDVCLPEDHAKALSTFSVLAGLGGSVGYLLGGINWEETRIGDFFGGNIRTVFAIVTLTFVLCFLITVTSFREIPLSLIEHDELLRPITILAVKNEMSKTPIQFINEKNYLTSLELRLSDMQIPKLNMNSDHDKQLNSLNSELSINLSSKEFALSVTSDMEDDDEENKAISLTQYLKSIVLMPKSMRILSLTNLLCWMGHCCYCLYFTDFVGEAVFHGDPIALQGSEEYTLYEEGVRFGCWGLAIYSLSCAIYSTVVEKLLTIFHTKVVYVGGILSYAIGMLILAYWPTKIGVLVLSITAGILYATLFTMPFILVAKYHAEGCFKQKSGENVPLKQYRGLGTDIAIISSMIFIAQLIVSLSIGSLISLLNSTSAVLYAASVASIGAAIAAMNVLYI